MLDSEGGPCANALVQVQQICGGREANPPPTFRGELKREELAPEVAQQHRRVFRRYGAFHERPTHALRV